MLVHAIYCIYVVNSRDQFFEYLIHNTVTTRNEYRIIKMEIYIILYLTYMEE